MTSTDRCPTPAAGTGRPMSEAPRDGTTKVQLHDGNAWWPIAWTWNASRKGWQHQFLWQFWREDRLGPTAWRDYVEPEREPPHPTAEGLRAVLKRHGISHWLKDATALAIVAEVSALANPESQHG